MTDETPASILYPADPFKAAAAVHYPPEADIFAPKPPAGQDVAAQARPADPDKDRADNLSTRSKPDAMYEHDAFAAQDKLGVNVEGLRPDIADQLDLEMPRDWMANAEPDDVKGAKEAFFAANLSQDLVGSITADFRTHAAAPITATRDEVMGDLRKIYGDQADAKLAMANEMVRRAASKWPGIYDALEMYGSGNDVKLIQKVIARAEHLKRRGKF